jgi:hypothetical protein
MPRLERLSDGEGFSGSIVESISWNEDGSFKEVTGSVPQVGESVKVGTATAGMFTNRDYWMTTPIIEIVKVEKNKEGKYEYMMFRTENSVYEITT